MLNSPVEERKDMSDTTKIEKCKICGEPYYCTVGIELPGNYDASACPDCNEKARLKAERNMNKPKQF